MEGNFRKLRFERVQKSLGLAHPLAAGGLAASPHLCLTSTSAKSAGLPNGPTPPAVLGSGAAELHFEWALGKIFDLLHLSSSE
jgi:hypothetical protein